MTAGCSKEENITTEVIDGITVTTYADGKDALTYQKNYNTEVGENGNTKAFVIRVSTMVPTLSLYDVVIAKTDVSPSEIKANDIVVFKSTHNPESGLVLRVIEVIENYNNTGKHAFRLRGDAHNKSTSFLQEEDTIIGKVIEIFHTNTKTKKSALIDERNKIFPKDNCTNESELPYSKGPKCNFENNILQID